MDYLRLRRAYAGYDFDDSDYENKWNEYGNSRKGRVPVYPRVTEPCSRILQTANLMLDGIPLVVPHAILNKVAREHLEWDSGKQPSEINLHNISRQIRLRVVQENPDRHPGHYYSQYSAQSRGASAEKDVLQNPL